MSDSVMGPSSSSTSPNAPLGVEQSQVQSMPAVHPLAEASPAQEAGNAGIAQLISTMNTFMQQNGNQSKRPVETNQDDMGEFESIFGIDDQAQNQQEEAEFKTSWDHTKDDWVAASNTINYLPPNLDINQLGQSLQEGDAAPLVELLKYSLKNAFVHMGSLQSAIAKKSIPMYLDRFASKDLPNKFADMQTQRAISSINNPLFTNKATAATAKATMKQILSKFPNLSAEEAAEKTINYYKAMASMANPTTSATSESSSDAEAFNFFD